jgi:hypothetical protein
MVLAVLRRAVLMSYKGFSGPGKIKGGAENAALISP